MNDLNFITVVDVSHFNYAERVCAAALQGLVNSSSLHPGFMRLHL